MIYADVNVARLLAILVILLSLGCMIYGAKHFYKPKVKHNKPSIYAKPPEKLTIMQRLKASWMVGWGAGKAYAEKKKQDRLNDK
jgi:hypothetical protein